MSQSITPTYIIGEIGQNHNGSVDIAKLIISMAARPIHEDLFNLNLKGINAIKLTKRDLNQELSANQMARLYENVNSFGKTYGQHREALELSDEEHYQIYQYVKSLGLDFVETLCAIGCLTILDKFLPDYLKVASRDLTNLPLLDAMASSRIPMILSTGMAGERELDDALNTISKHHEDIAILHCVSQYPTHPANVNLRTINFLKKNYSKYKIGYSDHTIGISVATSAVAMGAEIIEKHITIDRRMKGTDQKGSLGPDGVNRMIRDIRLLEKSMGVEKLFIELGVVTEAREKLERSIATARDIQKGELIEDLDVHLLSPGDGVKWRDRSGIIGKIANQNIPKDAIIYTEMVN